MSTFGNLDALSEDDWDKVGVAREPWIRSYADPSSSAGL